MKVTEVKFEREKRNGIIPVGTYLIDAALRLGVPLETECGRQGICDSCLVEVKKGGEFLSAPTKTEIEHLAEEKRKLGQRLACQAKIIDEGEIIAMTTEKKTVEPTEFEEFVKKFENLPLNEKVKKLLDLEMITLGETFSYILNLPYTIGEKIRDAMAEVGMKMDAEEKKTTRPAEHQEKTEDDSSEKKETSSTKKTTAKKSASSKKPTSEGKTTRSRQRKKAVEDTEKSEE